MKRIQIIVLSSFIPIMMFAQQTTNDISNVPWVAGINVSLVENIDVGTAQTGVIIGDKWVLTCAHNMDHTDFTSVGIRTFRAEDFTIQVGSNELIYQSTPATLTGYKVKQLHLHPNFQPLPDITENYDIMLLELETPITFGDNVQPIAYASENFFELVKPQSISRSGFPQPNLRADGYIDLDSRTLSARYFDPPRASLQYPVKDLEGIIFPGEQEGLLKWADVYNSIYSYGDSGGPLTLDYNGTPILIGLAEKFLANTSPPLTIITAGNQRHVITNSNQIITSYKVDIKNWIEEVTGISGVTKADLDKKITTNSAAIWTVGVLASSAIIIKLAYNKWTGRPTIGINVDNPNVELTTNPETSSVTVRKRKARKVEVKDADCE